MAELKPRFTDAHDDFSLNVTTMDGLHGHVIEKYVRQRVWDSEQRDGEIASFSVRQA